METDNAFLKTKQNISEADIHALVDEIKRKFVNIIRYKMRHYRLFFYLFGVTKRREERFRRDV